MSLPARSVRGEGETMRHVKDVSRIDRMWMCPRCNHKISVGDWYEKIDGKEYHAGNFQRKEGRSCADEKRAEIKKAQAKKRRERKVAKELREYEAMKLDVKRRKTLLVNAFGGRIKERAFDHFRESCKVIGIRLDEATEIWNDQNDLRDRYKEQVVEDLLKAVDGVLPV